MLSWRCYARAPLERERERERGGDRGTEGEGEREGEREGEKERGSVVETGAIVSGDSFRLFSSGTGSFEVHSN